MGGVSVVDQSCGSFLVKHNAEIVLFGGRCLNRASSPPSPLRSCFISGGWRPLYLEVGKAVDSIGVLRRDDDACAEGSAPGVTRRQLKAVQGRLGGPSSRLERSTVLKKKLGTFLMVEYRHGGDVYEKLESVPAGKEWH